MGTARMLVALLALTCFAVINCTADEQFLDKHGHQSARVRRQALNATTSDNTTTSTTPSPSTTTTVTSTTTTATTTTTAATTTNTATTTTNTATTTTNTATTTTRPANSTTNNSTSTTKALTTKSNRTTTRRPTTPEREPPIGARIPCADNNPKLLTTCCQSPIIDYFSDDLKKKCNYYKNNEPLFSITNEYTLNRMQNRISQTIDYSAPLFAKRFGDEACLVHCLFRQTEIMDAEGTIDEGLLSDYAAENLDDTWAQVVRDAVSDCVGAVDEVETQELQVLVKPKVTKMCKLKPSLIMQCIIKAVGVTCPDEYFNPTPACSRATSFLRYCNPYSAAGTEIGVRKASNKSKTRTKVTKKTATTKATTKASAVKKLAAKKFAPVLSKSHKAVQRRVAKNSTRVA